MYQCECFLNVKTFLSSDWERRGKASDWLALLGSTDQTPHRSLAHLKSLYNEEISPLSQLWRSHLFLSYGDLTSFSLAEISLLSLSSIMEISPLSHSYGYLRYFSLTEITCLSLLHGELRFFSLTEIPSIKIRIVRHKLCNFLASADITRPIRVLIWKEKNDFCPVILLFGLNI